MSVVAKLFMGPQDGAQVRIPVSKPLLTIQRPTGTGDPQDSFLDHYELRNDYCVDGECPFLHYEWVGTERTTDP